MAARGQMRCCLGLLRALVVAVLRLRLSLDDKLGYCGGCTRAGDGWHASVVEMVEEIRLPRKAGSATH